VSHWHDVRSTLVMLVVLLGTWCSRLSSAHDTLVQTSTSLVRTGDHVHVDLFLGNHGNDHRDFKLAGKLASLSDATLDILGPDGRRIDLVPESVDVGYTPKEGFWSARFVPGAAGLHCVAHTRVGTHLGKRGIKSGKAYFVAAERLDAPATEGVAHAEPLGHPLEIVPQFQPVLESGPGRPIDVQVVFRGQPLRDQRVSFIPRGVTLAADFDPAFERRTDASGRCRFEPRDGGLVLVVTHLEMPEERGVDFERTVYAATLVIDVPQRCRCCE